MKDNTKSIKLVKSKELISLAASHEDLDNPGVWKKILFTYNDLISGDIRMINWATIPGYRSFRMHYHEDLSEIFIVVSGRGKLIAQGKKYDISTGDAVFIPQMCLHQLTNTSGKNIVYIVIGITKSGQGQTIVPSENPV